MIRASASLCRFERGALVGIVAVAAALRLAWPRLSPPGIHVDAAANAWNASCLLETGRDWLGEPWPIFYSRGFGESQTTLAYYLLLPFQAIAGMSVETTRLPTALCGIATCVLLFFLGRRLFDSSTGLVAAALLAITPWHLLLSRSGHEAGLTPFLIVASLACVSWAELPFGDRPQMTAMPVRALIAGLLVGVCCYGYLAVRVFLPIFLVVAVLVSLDRWWDRDVPRRGVKALFGLLVGLAVTLGPLLWRHWTDPEIGKRAREFVIGTSTDSSLGGVGQVLARYFRYFGPDYLFIHGDRWILNAVPDSGVFQIYMLPLMALGLLLTARSIARSRSARVLLSWVALYPVGDILTRHVSVNSFRSSPGLCGLVLLAAVGAVHTVRWIRARSRTAAIVAAALAVILAVGSSARFLRTFFGDYNRRPDVYYAFNADLLEASRWIRPRLADLAAVFVTTEGGGALKQPFVVVLLGLQYSPSQWFEDVHVVRHRPDTDLQVQFGKIRFLFERSDLEGIEEFRRGSRHGRVLFVIRPGQLGLRDPVQVIRGPDGKEALWLCEREF